MFIRKGHQVQKAILIPDKYVGLAMLESDTVLYKHRPLNTVEKSLVFGQQEISLEN